MGIEKKIYESSKAKVFVSWILAATLTMFLSTIFVGLFIMWADVHRDTFFDLLPYLVLFSVAIATYLALFRWNIKVEVTDREVIFLRAGRSYQQFKFSENNFSSLVEKTLGDFGFIGATTYRFLQVFPHGAEHGKNYKFHNFSAQTFEECMAHINSHNVKQTLQREVFVLDENLATEESLDDAAVSVPLGDLIGQSIESLKAEPLEFHVNKQAYIRKKKQALLSLGIPLASVTVLLVLGVLVMPVIAQNQLAIDNLAISVMYILFLVGIFAVLGIVLGWLPYKNARDNTPEKIVVHHDRIAIDGKAFDFDRVHQIRMTTPDVVGNVRFVSDTKSYRSLVIVQNNQSVKYALGDSSDGVSSNFLRKGNVKTFENYDELFSVLFTIFALRAQKGKANPLTIT